MGKKMETEKQTHTEIYKPVGTSVNGQWTIELGLCRKVRQGADIIMDVRKNLNESNLSGGTQAQYSGDHSLGPILTHHYCSSGRYSVKNHLQ